jgi:hypothetical protein
MIASFIIPSLPCRAVDYIGQMAYSATLLRRPPPCSGSRQSDLAASSHATDEIRANNTPERRNP